MRHPFVSRTVAAFALGTMLTSGIPAYAYDEYYDRRPESYDRYEQEGRYERDYRTDTRYEPQQQQSPYQAPSRPAPGYGTPFGMSKSAAGAVAGAVLGAGSGAIVGSHRGKAGPGALIGAGVGALGGYMMGKQIENQDYALDAEEQVINQQRQEIARNRALIEELKRGRLDARETRRGVVVNLPDVLFEYNKADLTRGAQEKVTYIAEVLERRAGGRQVSVEGHTDSIGSESYNLGLSQRRAATVTRELASNGVREDYLRTQGFGEKYPVAPNTQQNGVDNPSGRAKNRRVEVVIEN
jgi:outer membrane protein OmpA-like peptidoglycan-associated protein